MAEHRHASHDEGQFGVGALEIKTHFTLTQHRQALDFTEIRSKLGGSLFAGQALIRVLDIQSQYRVSVVKPGQGVELEGDRQTILGHTDILGQQTIRGGGFIEIAHQQGLKHQTAQSRWGGAFEGEWVVFVKAGGTRGGHHRNAAALGRLRVDITEMGEARWVLDVAKLGVGMRGPCGKSREQKGDRQKNAHATILQDFSGASS